MQEHTPKFTIVILFLAFVGGILAGQFATKCPDCPECPPVQCGDCKLDELNELKEKIASLGAPSCPPCPQPICNYSFKCDPKISFDLKYIQAPHTKINYSLINDNLIIKNVTLTSVTGYSMQPTLFTNNKIILKKYKNKDELKEGQIIYYDAGGEKRVHRIKGLYDKYLVVQGDNLSTEEVIKYDQIEYIVVGVLYE